MSDDADLVVLVTVPREVEAQLIVDALKEKGVMAHFAGGAISGFKVGVPGDLQIIVRAEDHPRATAALREIREEADHIDWSEIAIDERES